MALLSLLLLSLSPTAYGDLTKDEVRDIMDGTTNCEDICRRDRTWVEMRPNEIWAKSHGDCVQIDADHNRAIQLSDSILDWEGVCVKIVGKPTKYWLQKAIAGVGKTCRSELGWSEKPGIIAGLDLLPIFARRRVLVGARLFDKRAQVNSGTAFIDVGVHAKVKITARPPRPWRLLLASLGVFGHRWETTRSKLSSRSQIIKKPLQALFG